ncbi:hypothetical protein TCON_0886 [Astathelohania contejeani]|uniref:Uncharacterized protein n=1 Tax=Astathelohania contejeani TaxID=164912 RepID=A0ABQ7I0D3_9MICR|nr:hypothetical protein TCON_0886 [Thelohania contejeani]
MNIILLFINTIWLSSFETIKNDLLAAEIKNPSSVHHLSKAIDYYSVLTKTEELSADAEIEIFIVKNLNEISNTSLKINDDVLENFFKFLYLYTLTTTKIISDEMINLLINIVYTNNTQTIFFALKYIIDLTNNGIEANDKDKLKLFSSTFFDLKLYSIEQTLKKILETKNNMIRNLSLLCIIDSPFSSFKDESGIFFNLFMVYHQLFEELDKIIFNMPDIEMKIFIMKIDAISLYLSLNGIEDFKPFANQIFTNSMMLISYLKFYPYDINQKKYYNILKLFFEHYMLLERTLQPLSDDNSHSEFNPLNFMLDIKEIELPYLTKTTKEELQIFLNILKLIDDENLILTNINLNLINKTVKLSNEYVNYIDNKDTKEIEGVLKDSKNLLLFLMMLSFTLVQCDNETIQSNILNSFSIIYEDIIKLQKNHRNDCIVAICVILKYVLFQIQPINKSQIDVLTSIINKSSDAELEYAIKIVSGFATNIHKIFESTKLNSISRIILTKDMVSANAPYGQILKITNQDLISVYKNFMKKFSNKESIPLIKYIKYDGNTMLIQTWFGYCICHQKIFFLNKSENSGLVAINNKYVDGLQLMPCSNENITEIHKLNSVLIGIILGNVLLGNLGKMAFPLAVPFLTLLLGKILTFDDIKYFDEKSYKKWYKNIGKKELNKKKFPCKFFDIPVINATINIDLGSKKNISLQEYNQQKICALQGTTLYLRDNLYFQGIKKGLEKVIDIEKLSNLNGYELFLLINGGSEKLKRKSNESKIFEIK